ncbi:MAG: hypothetical protein R3B99_26570 [Polyangiales bacterium]
MPTTATFLSRTITAFFFRQKPLSTRAKPECMKKTRKALSSTQTESRRP